MALDARHRSSIYTKLVPLIGEDDANALMSEFPSVEADELVTKQFLRAELAELRRDMASGLASLRGDLDGGLAGLRGEMDSGFAGLRGDMDSRLAGLRGDMDSRLAGLRGDMDSGFAAVRTELAELENRLTVRLGGAIASSTAVLAALVMFR